MLSLYTPKRMEAALEAPIDPTLKKLLADRIDDARKTDLLTRTHFLVIQPGDTEQAIIDELGMTPLTNPLDRSRYGTPTFGPWWDFLDSPANGWFEIVVCVGNGGWAAILLIENVDGTIPELLDLCRTYAHEPSDDKPVELTK